MSCKVTPSFVCCFAVLLITEVTTRRYVTAQEKDFYSYYSVDAAVVSLDANQSLASYPSGGKRSGSPGARLGYSTPEVAISIALLLEADRLFADVTTRPLGTSEHDGERKERIDLTSLRPTSLDLGMDKNGRVYHLNLTPSVVSVRLKPTSLAKATDDLFQLHFHASRIILNDKTYVGRMLASGSQVFNIELRGVASLEFSLRRLKGAEPWGRLQNGQITLSHPDGASIEIGNVTNGADDRLVGGGPYTVWVRWKKPHQSVDEYRTTLSQCLDQLKRSAPEHAASITTALGLAFIEQELAREPGPWVTSYGACDLPKNEFSSEE